MTGWFVVHTQPRMEVVAVDNLSRLGFDTYLPRFKKRRSHAGRIDEVSAPLFPRYIFVGFDTHAANWHVIRSTRGAIDVVRQGNNPSLIPFQVVDEIRSREDTTGHVVLAKQFAPKSGERVRIQNGAFSQQTAIFTAMKDSERVVALLSLLGREISVTMPISHIAPIT